MCKIIREQCPELAQKRAQVLTPAQTISGCMAWAIALESSASSSRKRAYLCVTLSPMLGNVIYVSFILQLEQDTLKINIPRKIIRQLRYPLSCKYLTKTFKVVSVGGRDEIGGRRWDNVTPEKCEKGLWGPWHPTRLISTRSVSQCPWWGAVQGIHGFRARSRGAWDYRTSQDL